MDWQRMQDLNMDHYQFARRCPGFYPDEDRDTFADKVADRVVLIVAALVIGLIVFGVLQ